MDVAIDLISQLPNYPLKIMLLIFSFSLFFLPLIERVRHWKSSSGRLKDAKMMLEMRKLILEIREKTINVSPLAEDGKYPLQLAASTPDSFLTTELNERGEGLNGISYYHKVRYALPGSLFFFLMMGIVTLLRSENGFSHWRDYLAFVSQDSSFCQASAFMATLIPWGHKTMFFVYGFFIPIAISTIIVSI